MKTPSEIANAFIAAMEPDRQDRCRRAFDALLPAANGETIYGGEFEQPKKTLDRSFEETVEKLKNRHHTPHWDANQNLTPYGQLSNDLGHIFGVRDAVADSKKLAKSKVDIPLVRELKALYAKAIPVHEMLEAIKKKVIKGRRPAAVSSKEKRILGRVGGSGTCQVCVGNQAIVRGNIALHGYERPGHGYITGRCYGANRLPFEIACDALKEWIGKLKQYLTQAHDDLARLPFAKEFMIEVYKRDAGGRMIYDGRKPAMKLETIHPEHPKFEVARQKKIRATEHAITQITRDIAFQQKRLDAWVPTATA